MDNDKFDDLAESVKQGGIMRELDADFAELVRLREENQRLQSLVTAYENDLVLVDVAEKLKLSVAVIDGLRTENEYMLGEVERLRNENSKLSGRRNITFHSGNCGIFSGRVCDCDYGKRR